jgi:hypothetical protein
VIEDVEAEPCTIATDGQESDGSLAWDDATVVPARRVLAHPDERAAQARPSAGA